MASVRRKSNQDPDSTSEFIVRMRKKHPSDLVLYRGNSPKHELLFCYQSTWQSRLLNRYGNQFCLLDAAHRTLGGSKLLFLLFVRTNVAYVAVGAFIIENESLPRIQEALDIFAKWNPNWSPSNFVVDVAATDIKAVEACFKDCTVSLSDFHREKAWSDLISKNLEQKKDGIIPMLRRIAHAESTEKYRDSLSRLLNSSELKDNENLRTVLTTTWLPEAKRWVRCFQDECFYITVHAAGGVEKQTEALRYQGMESYLNGSLKELVSGLIMNFFPDSYRKYLERNARSSSGYSHSSASIPSFLQNRPRAIVRHIQDRMKNGIPSETIVNHGNGVFGSQLASENTTLAFGNETQMPYCTCRDWHQHYLPCKHFCAVFLNFTEWQWDSLSYAYRTNPIFSLDEAFLVASTDQLTSESHKEGIGVEEEVEAEEEQEEDMEEEVRGCSSADSVSIREKEGERERKRALRECAETTRALNAAIKKMRDTSQILSVSQGLKDLLENVNNRLAVEACAEMGAVPDAPDARTSNSVSRGLKNLLEDVNDGLALQACVDMGSLTSAADDRTINTAVTVVAP